MSQCSIHKLIAGVVVTAGGKALLLKYKDAGRHDGETGWFQPDDTLSDFEDPERGAARVLREPLGLEAKALTLGLFESFKGHDGTHHLMFNYRAEFSKPPALKLGKNVAEAKWFHLRKMPPREEFAHHGWALDVITRVTKG
jgi:ADP-ribose pyrophosphatase YjhB (NUDIX family)